MKHLIVALVLALCSCKKSTAPKLTPPTTEEAEAFAKSFASSLAPCDAAALDQVIDVDLLISRALAKQSGDFDQEEFKRGMKRGLGGLGKNLCNQLSAQDAKAAYLRMAPEGGPRPLVRVISEAGVNYYRLELDKRDGKVRLADLYIYMNGENMSDTLAAMISAIGRSGLASAAQLKDIRERMQQGEWEEAQAMIDKLPAQLKSSKPMMLAAVQIASELGDDAYLKALNAYSAAFPNDPSLALTAIDRALLRKQYDTALKYVIELDTRIGGDPYLDVLRAGVLSMADKAEESVAAAKRATEREPTLEDAWWQLLTSQAQAKQHGEALASLEVLRDKFNANITTDALAGDERFGALVASPEYVAWAAKQPAAAE